MVIFPRYSLAGFLVLAILGIVFIASANRSYDKAGGLALGEQVDDPLGDISVPEGADVVSIDSARLPENLMTEARLPQSAGREGFGLGDDSRRDTQTLTAGETVITESRSHEKKIVIRLRSQTMDLIERGVVTHSFPISSGKRGMETPIGTFTVLNKKRRAYSRTYGLYMPYWLGFTTRGHGIHELPEWPNGYKEGEHHLGTPVSHGCVRLGVGPAQVVYDWAEVGTIVEVVQS